MGATVATPEAAADRREPEPRPTVESRPTRERTISTGKPAEETGSRRGGKRRRASKDNEATGTIRYFLTKPTSNGTPELGEEMADEHQALLGRSQGRSEFRNDRGMDGQSGQAERSNGTWEGSRRPALGFSYDDHLASLHRVNLLRRPGALPGKCWFGDSIEFRPR